MSNFLNSYSVFEDNQVLTSSQLNDTVAYLEEQNRLTRSKLIGTGIACGLDLTYIASPVTSIAFSQGMGITSEGYVISLGDCVVKRYRPYTLPSGVHYPPFENPTTKTQDVTLYELLTDDAPTLPSDVITPLDPAFCANKVVLLFIEIVDADLQSCLGKACDENGMERVFNLRKLLISKDDLDKKVFLRTCSENLPFQLKYTLPEIIMKRPLFSSTAGSLDSGDYFAFSQNYANAVKSAVNPDVGTADIYTTLFSALSQTYTDFASVLAPVYTAGNPFAGFPVVGWTDFMNGTASGGPKYLGMQYFYDFIEDLILAYNQFRNVAFDLMTACCNDMTCFPQHLMVGEVIPGSLNLPSKYRHYFIPSPIFNNQKERLDEVIFYHKRMVLMLRRFKIGTINPPVTDPLPQTFITPSREKRQALSERAIPYYYDITTPDSDLGDLNHTWNYSFKKQWLYGKNLLPLAYGNMNAVQTTDKGPVKTPLFYDIDPYNFFRIEGHLRKNYVAAKNEVEDLKAAFDLPFNVVTLRLNGAPYDDITERCNFDDLRTMYGTLRTELLSMFDDVFNRFGSMGTSAPVARQLPDFIKGLMGNLIQTTVNGSITQPQIGTGLQNVTISPFTWPAVLPNVNLSAVDISSSSVNNTTGLRVAGTVAPVPFFDLSHILGTQNITINTTGPLYAQQRSLSTVQSQYYTDALALVTEIDTLRSQFLPFNITHFQFGYTGQTQDSTLGFIQHYFNALQRAINVKVSFIQLLDLIIHNTALRNTPELYADLLAYWNETVGLLERFITDAKYKSLTLVNYTFQYRINQLKQNDMTLFSNFAKKNPGMEHKGGVPAGGTFIMVYNGNSLTVDNNSVNYAVDLANKKYQYETRKAQILAKPVKSAQDQIELSEIEATLLNLSTTTTALASSVPIQSIALSGDQIIADFSLPYLCCCDCECEDIPHVTDVSQLNMPALAPPFYVEYNLGDYAFAKDSDIGIHNNITNAVWFYLDIIPLLQYETVNPANKIRLYLIDKYGNKVAYSAAPVSIGTNVFAASTVQTFNDCNVPTNVTSFGTAAVVTYSSTSTPQKLGYKPENGFDGTDSFFYMFEVLDASNNVIRRSGMGKVTITVDKSDSTRNISYGNVIVVSQQQNIPIQGQQQA